MGLLTEAEKGTLAATPQFDDKQGAARELAGRKRAAVELIRNHDVALRSSARRYSICADDADDAYQRGIEILLSKAPTTDLRQLLPWTRTVIKHEALAVRKVRERTMGRPATFSPKEEAEDWIDLIPASGDGPDERAVKREKVARSREALARLKPHELKALTMLAEGYSYAEIASINRWTRTKVNRCLAEGRQRFRSVFQESESGELCAGFESMISACCDGEIESEKLIELEDHLAACGTCRATLRTYRAVPRAAAALTPAIPLAHTLWERLQEAALSAQIRFQGLGHGTDASLTPVAISGGTRGAGAAVLAKIATICVGTAGGAAACMATGVLPTPELPVRDSRPAIERQAESPPVRPAAPVGAPSTVESPDPVKTVNTVPDPPRKSNPPERQATASSAAPPPTPTETEFTPETAGTPVAAPPPTTSSPPPARTSSVPAGGGGGEFAP